MMVREDSIGPLHSKLTESVHPAGWGASAGRNHNASGVVWAAGLGGDKDPSERGSDAGGREGGGGGRRKGQSAPKGFAPARAGNGSASGPRGKKQAKGKQKREKMSDAQLLRQLLSGQDLEDFIGLTPHVVGGARELKELSRMLGSDEVVVLDLEEEDEELIRELLGEEGVRLLKDGVGGQGQGQGQGQGRGERGGSAEVLVSTSELGLKDRARAVVASEAKEEQHVEDVEDWMSEGVDEEKEEPEVVAAVAEPLDDFDDEEVDDEEDDDVSLKDKRVVSSHIKGEYRALPSPRRWRALDAWRVSADVKLSEYFKDKVKARSSRDKFLADTGFSRAEVGGREALVVGSAGGWTPAVWSAGAPPPAFCRGVLQHACERLLHDHHHVVEPLRVAVVVPRGTGARAVRHHGLGAGVVRHGQEARRAARERGQHRERGADEGVPPAEGQQAAAAGAAAGAGGRGGAGRAGHRRRQGRLPQQAPAEEAGTQGHRHRGCAWLRGRATAAHQGRYAAIVPGHRVTAAHVLSGRHG
jgi:hypothetical protein